MHWALKCHSGVNSTIGAQTQSSCKIMIKGKLPLATSTMTNSYAENIIPYITDARAKSTVIVFHGRCCQE
ncbi:hypothetical protein A0H81_02724 [Grifola frondosa]|uniref:Uncharacterized protein n=1 Tax=Grifola frondosa TaxID=5627 RepID=A0A1C7MLD5_GRIFR|nr:hypothetical protein A0H81_02724 [Grifola frondosa]